MDMYHNNVCFLSEYSRVNSGSHLVAPRLVEFRSLPTGCVGSLVSGFR